MNAQKFTLRIYRGLPGNQYWEEFEFSLRPFLNIISCLMQIQREPINKQGKKVEPVIFETGCLEEVCGSCSLLINGYPRQACTALVEPILKETSSDTILLAPFTKFPLVRDLVIDRSIMFENLKKVQAWIDADGAFNRGPGPENQPNSSGSPLFAVHLYDVRMLCGGLSAIQQKIQICRTADLCPGTPV